MDAAESTTRGDRKFHAGSVVLLTAYAYWLGVLVGWFLWD